MLFRSHIPYIGVVLVYDVRGCVPVERQYERTNLPRTIVRAEASPTADVVATVPEGTELEILSVGDAYREVSVWLPERGHVRGYVESRKLGYEPLIQPQENVPAATCICGASDWRIFSVRDGRGYRLNIATGFFSSVLAQARVCMACGRIEQYVDKDDIERLRNIRQED